MVPTRPGEKITMLFFVYRNKSVTHRTAISDPKITEDLTPLIYIKEKRFAIQFNLYNAAPAYGNNSTGGASKGRHSLYCLLRSPKIVGVG